MRKVCCLAVLGVALLLSGCAGPQSTPVAAGPSAATPGSSATSSPSPPTAASPATSTSARPKDPTPSVSAEPPATLRFTGTTVDGDAFDGAKLAGKPVLLWFWAPWCPICRGQIDQVQAIAHDHAGSVNVVGVGSLDDAKAISGFAADAAGITHLSDESGAIWRHFEVVQQSSFVLLDAKGAKVYAVGYGGSDELADRVAAVAG